MLKGNVDDDAVTKRSPSFSSSITRRGFIEHGAALAGVGLLPMSQWVQEVSGDRRGGMDSASSLLEILRFPDRLVAYEDLANPKVLARSGEEWLGAGITVRTSTDSEELKIAVHAPALALRYAHLRWNQRVPSTIRVIGDAWERSYGELGWRNIIPERMMPWYMATYDAQVCNAYGVKTGAGAFCFWQLDSDGVSLWLNLSSGGSGVQLGGRVLDAATVVTQQGHTGEDITAALHRFCRRMCSQPTRPMGPVYGTDDWYYAYGHNTAKRILNDTDFIAALSQNSEVRPFSVVDMGWVDGSTAYPSMHELAGEIRKRDVRPGVWIRPLLAPSITDPKLLICGNRSGQKRDCDQDPVYDPTIPEGMEKILDCGRQAVQWGFELVKQDFLTYDLFGLWGPEMGPTVTRPGWSFADSTLTNAEIVKKLYHAIRAACGDKTVLIGCNAIVHLSQGYFDVVRTGDDTSGKQWERTRRMGVNTLAFRLAQHDAFFVLDPDCVPITAAIPWEKTAEWLQLVAHTGTALFISPGEGSHTPEHANLIREMLQLAVNGGDHVRPLDLLEISTPRIWGTGESGSRTLEPLRFDWCEDGAFPFKV